MDISLSPVFICGDNRIPCTISRGQTSQPISRGPVDQPEDQAWRELVPKIPSPELPAVIDKAEADGVVSPSRKVPKTGSLDRARVHDIVEGHFVRVAVEQIFPVRP